MSLLKQLLLTLTAFILGFQSIPQSSAIELVKNNKTKYAIVLKQNASPIDKYSATILSDYLKQMTRANFPVIDKSKLKPGQPAIFVGKNNIGRLKTQEYVVKSNGQNILLYGEGKHGALSAVLYFLENKLGWRWYSQFEKPVVPKKATIELKPFSISRQNSYLSRQPICRWGWKYNYQNGANDGFEMKARRRNVDVKNSPVRSNLAAEVQVHSIHSYIPPLPNAKYAKKIACLKKRDYFKTNPEYFSMAQNGKRVKNLQLCFSNKALRNELTKNIFEHLKQKGTDQYITVDAADTPKKFCYCPGCKALEKKYGSPGGPLYDYLFELCRIMKKKYPGVYIKTLAYRRSQTQKPPKLPAGKKLPDNLMVSFAPIEDVYFADWNHPDKKIQGTYQDLKDWNKITRKGNLRAWLYPNPWRSGKYVPVGNIERAATQMKLMHKAGVRGVFIDHNGYLSRSGFSELQSWLILKLAQDINQDPKALIVEFTNNQFGKAAPLARKYMKELEQGRKNMKKLPQDVTFRSQGFNNVNFPYLTVENIHRWETYFDKMEELVKGNRRQLLNVKLMRRELDVAALWKWFELKKAYPKYYTDEQKLVKRFKAANASKAVNGIKPQALTNEILVDFLMVIAGGGKNKALPKQFDGIPAKDIRQFMPSNQAKRERKRMIQDPDAARGYAITINRPGSPLKISFFNVKTKKRRTVLSIGKGQFTPGKYKFYKLGRITISPNCKIMFGKSGATNIQLGTRLYEPGEHNKWDAYVSIKIKGKEAFCDRVVLVKK